MRQGIWYIVAIGLLLSCDRSAVAGEPQSKGEVYSFRQPHMGTLFTIRVWVPKDRLCRFEQDVGAYADSDKGLAVAVDQAFARIAEVNQIGSDWLVESQLNDLARAPVDQPVRVSVELIEMLLVAEDLAIQSEGVFDVTVGPLVRLWRRSIHSRQLPSELQIEGAKTRVGFEKLTIDAKAKTVTKGVENMAFDLGGIAKGYAADQALRILREAGYPFSLVAASGDIAVGDTPPDRRGWRVGLGTFEMAKAGERSIELSHCAVSTSGDTNQFLIIDGKRYSHIVNPVTGLGLTERIGVSVIAADATTSDSYATAVSLLGREAGLRLIESTSGVEARIVVVNDTGVTEEYLSSGFPK